MAKLTRAQFAEMLVNMTLLLPDLDDPIAYPHDGGEHPGGGHCLDLLGEGDSARWRHILEQQHAAFTDLTSRARACIDETGGGCYEVTRPLLFLAHHVSEVAIKVGLAGTSSGLGRPDHSLPGLCRRLVDAGGIASLSDAESAWDERFVAQMQRITISGFDGRYADVRFTEDAWCCLHLDHLEACVTVFANLMLGPDTA